ncbi:MAG: Gfo/Idh/MocA family oxidoreductase [Chloroflexia bacterium]|nr:Gfo/Idh/MocA family oxidoreductase [Chloroflexia bacterium]
MATASSPRRLVRRCGASRWKGAGIVARLGLVGVNTSHAEAFARVFNGTGEQPPEIEGGKIVALWGDDRARADLLAEVYGIPTVVAEPASMVEDIDAVLIVDDTGGGATHADLARPYLTAGVPTFIDKPMTLHYEDAVALFDLAARHDAPLMSCSALRYAAELTDLRVRLPDLGALSSVVSTSPGDWYYYGVHAVEQLVAVLGTGATWVHRHAFPQRDIAVIGYEDGPTAIVQTLRDAGYLFQLTCYGEHGWDRTEIEDVDGFYRATIAAVLRMIATGRAPIKREETLEILAILHAGLRSAETGAPVELATIQGQRER